MCDTVCVLTVSPLCFTALCPHAAASCTRTHTSEAEQGKRAGCEYYWRWMVTYSENTTVDHIMTGVESILLEELDWIVCQSHVGDGVGLHVDLSWFWLCPKIITFWEDVHLVTVRILDYDFTKSCVLLSLAIWRGSWWLAENGEWNVCHGAADSWDKNLRKRKVGWMAGPHIHNRIRTITPTSSQGQAVETWQSSLFLFSCFLSFNITSSFVLGLEIKY